MWDIRHLQKKSEIKETDKKHKYETNIEILLRYFDMGRIKVYPTKRIFSLLHELKNDVKNTPAILNKYYNQPPPTKIL